MKNDIFLTIITSSVSDAQIVDLALISVVYGIHLVIRVTGLGYQPQKFFEKCTSYSVKYTAHFVGKILIWQILNNIKLLL